MTTRSDLAQVSIYLPKDVYERVRHVAFFSSCKTTSKYVRRLIENELGRLERENLKGMKRRKQP